MAGLLRRGAVLLGPMSAKSKISRVILSTPFARRTSTIASWRQLSAPSAATLCPLWWIFLFHYIRNDRYPGPTRIEWCHASGNAHHTSAPRMACPRANGRIFRSFANSHAMPVPPTNVKGTSTGFGQCNAANTMPATNAATSGFWNAASSRLVTKEFSPTCCSRQNARYPPNRRGSIKWDGKRCTIPRNNPAKQISRELIPKKQAARFVAGHKLSARHPMVLGVSRRATKLTTSHAKNTRHVHGAAACNFQM